MRRFAPPYSFRVSRRAFPRWLLLAACSVIPPALPAQQAGIRIQEDYTWPDKAVLRFGMKQGDLLLMSRSEQRAGGGPSLSCGMSLPWLRCGPLLPRGMMRLVSDPVAFSAGSGVFDERTGFALDGALPAVGPGVLFMPIPDLLGVSIRPGREGGTELGAFGRLPFGRGAAAECAVYASRPDPRPAPDEWFLDRAPFPGGDLTCLGARLALDSPTLDFSFAAGASSARRAAPGAFSTLWIRGRLPLIEGAVLLAGATPGYRAPDGAGATDASRFSSAVRLGDQRGTGSLEAGFSFTAAAPGFSPGRETPTRNVIRAAFARDVESASGWPLSTLLEVEKDVSRDRDGVRHETSRCSSTACLFLGSVDLRGGVGISDHDGVGIHGSLTLRPSSALRLGVEAKGERLLALAPSGSVLTRLAIESGGRSAALWIGIEDCPLGSGHGRPAENLAAAFRARLSCAFRGP